MSSPGLHEVRLLGRPAIHAGGVWSDLKPGLTSAVLGYLAFENRWVERGELAALFWPDRSEEVARGNLRPLLWRLAREPMPIGLERERSRVRWPVRTDHQSFVDACRAQRWRDAWALSQGELLTGVSLPAAPEFDAWLEMERGTVTNALRTAAMRVAEDAAQAGNLEVAADVLGSLYRLDAFDEAVLRALVDALDRRGSRADALATLTRFERLCREELGTEPDPRTRALAAAIRAGRPTSAPWIPSPGRRPAGAPPHSLPLPAPLTPLVGRQDLVTAVSRSLADPVCRVLTLIGPGGVGKTRIAIEVARQVAARYGDGVGFAELAARSSHGGLIAAVAGAMAIDLAPGEDPERQVLHALQPRHALLVLDNAEHLDALPAFVAKAVHRAPRVTVLITSRRAIPLSGGCIVDVTGLAHRDDERRGRRPVSVVAEVPRPTEAAELFVQTMRRAGTPTDPADGAAIERLCSRLGGVPLALELAAAWTRILGLDEIEAALTHGLDILSDDAPERPARHASMREVFERSWAMLLPRERAAMRRLAPFRGGFTVQAAREAAGVELPVLLALVNKSFLRRSGTGRLSRHPLVWHFARERAEEHAAELEASRDRHAVHFIEFLAARHEAFHHPDGARMMLEIDGDLENVTVAWRWACEREHRSLLRSAVVSLGRFCWAWGRYDVQDDLMTAALEVAGDDGVLRGLLLAHQGSAKTWRALGDFGASLLDQALPLLESAAGPAEVAWVLRLHANASGRHGRHDRAAESAERAVTLYRQVGDIEGELVMTSVANGRAETVGAALAAYDRLIDRARAAGAAHPLGMALAGRAGMLALQGDFVAAEAAVREAQRLHRGVRAPVWSLDRRNLRALVCIERGRLRVARALCCRTLAGRGRSAAEVHALGDAATVAMAARALIDYLEDDHVSAERWARRALDHHRSSHGPSASYDLATHVLTRIALASGDLAAARRLLDDFGRGPEPRWYAGPIPRAATMTAVMACRAEVALAGGDDDAAAAALRAALQQARRIEMLAAGLAALVPVARLLERRGDRTRARRLATFLHRHPRATFETRRAAACLPGAEDATAHDGDPDAVLAMLDEAIAAI